MNYDAANAFLKRRLNLATALSSRGISEEVAASVRQRSFFSARVAEARVLRVLRRMSDAYSRGDLSLTEARTMLKRWLDREHPGRYDPDDNRITNLASTARLDLILRQNAAMAAAVGRYEVGMDPDVLERWPNWRYITGPNPRDSHAMYDGMVFAKTDPIWRKIYPPWEFHCNCDVEDTDEPASRSNGKSPPPPESGYSFDPTDAFAFSTDEIQDTEVRKIVEERMTL